MAEESTQQQAAEQTAQTPNEPHGADGTDWKAEARKWEGRAKSNNDRIRELEEKAKRLDELEAANKSDIERANDAATKAQASADEWKSKFEALESERRHELDVREKAAQYGIDADVLMRMGGDVEENAKFLKAKEAARPKFGDMGDGGEQRQATVTPEQIDAIKDPVARVRARAAYIHNNR